MIKETKTLIVCVSPGRTARGRTGQIRLWRMPPLIRRRRQGSVNERVKIDSENNVTLDGEKMIFFIFDSEARKDRYAEQGCSRPESGCYGLDAICPTY
jgi:hypothetical protein